MTEPEVSCATCGKRRSCRKHLRADHPPTAAKAWLRRHCQTDGKPCQLNYRAGIDVEGLRATLQGKIR
jgi:hypothetical protein